MTSFLNTIRPEDYTEINAGVEAVKRTVGWVEQNGMSFDIGHPHRFWEYGSAVQVAMGVFQHKMDRIKVLEVGSGMGALGPTFAYCFGSQVTECEPNITYSNTRVRINQLLEAAQKPKMIVAPVGVDALPNEQYDVVTCISVIEHLPKHLEERCWEELVKRVKWGGVLFVTVDCVEFADKPYEFDNLRVQNFTTEMIKERIEKVRKLGLTPMGAPDYTYYGPRVFNYTFYRMGFLKMGAANEFSSRTSNNMGRTLRNSRVRTEPSE